MVIMLLSKYMANNQLNRKCVIVCVCVAVRLFADSIV
jgi:hypothetical protein